MLIGANPAISTMSWVGTVPEGWRRILARPAGAELIVLDPRLTETAQHATLHLSVLPDTDWAVLLIMLKYIRGRGMIAPTVENQATGLPAFLELLDGIEDIDRLCDYCGLTREAIEDAADRFARAATAACIARTGPAMGRFGTLTEWLSQVLNTVTGRTDVRGGRYLNVTPVNPIEMGVKLFPEQRKPSRVHQRAPVAGAYALGDLPEEIETPGPGQIRALIINAGNPVISGPDGPSLAAALRKLDLLIGVDMFARESLKDAHWLIPGTHFLEREEFNPLIDAMNTDPHLQVGRAALPPPPEVRPEWMFYRDLAERLGLVLFEGAIPPQPRALIDLMLSSGVSGISYEDISNAPHGISLPSKGFGHLSKWTLTESGKINLAPEPLLWRMREAIASLPKPAQETYAMISRRRMASMNSWLVNTIGASMRDQRSDAIEMNTSDALAAGFSEGDCIEVSTCTGSLEARLIVSDAIRPGVVVMEHGWGGSTINVTDGSSVSVGVNKNVLVSSSDIDPLSSVSRLNGTQVHLSRMAAR